MHYLERELTELIQVDKNLFDYLDAHLFDGIWFWNLEQPEDEWLSPGFWRTLGYDPEEKTHHSANWQAVIHPEDLEVARRDLELHCAFDNHPYDQIVRFTHKNGDTVWVRCRGVAIRDSQGNAVRMLGIHTEISRLKQIEDRYKKIISTMDRVYADLRIALEESEQLFESMPDAVLQVDHGGNIIKANTQASLLFGYTTKELIEMTVEDLVPESSRAAHFNYRTAYQKSPEVREMGGDAVNLMAQTRSGKVLYVDIRLSPIQTKYGSNTIAVIRDVTERKKLQQELERQKQDEKKLFEMSITDSLTGLYNRGYFMELAERAFKQAGRYNHGLCVMMIDIDDFKIINDNFGHAEGDRALTQIGSLLKSSIRETDVVGRIGGEEFAIYLPEASLDQGVILADKILFNIEDARSNSLVKEGAGACPSVSIGLAVKQSDDDSLSELLYRADQQLYKAKANGKARVVY
ncbi:PAS domain S-box-containing protein/diguanylate cyclase (GGDEF)-like protein [Alteromonadaceae bacterium 2753L.S.0a.02]|nr:PAS domain S-box-containing protein/diguanylate cyclase (GGDEF)-like protein [Alteromonadaceae bacterium 2753L.S.0a.02]